MKKFLTVATVAGALVFGAAAHADILYNSLGGSSAGSDPVASYGPLADSFSVGASPMTLTSITVLISGDPFGTGQTQIALMSDNGSGPGDVIATGLFGDNLTSATLSPLTAAGSISLAANTRYWIQLSSVDNSSVSWSYTYDNSGYGVSGEYFANSSGVYSNVNGPYQMEVLAAPEPEAWVLMLIGVGGLGAALRRRSARRAAA